MKINGLSFFDNYKALKIITALLLFCSFANGQIAIDTTKSLQKVAGRGFEWQGSGQFNNSLVIPRDTPLLALKDSGAIAYKGGQFWMFNGTYWLATSSGTVLVHSSDYDSLTINGSTICKWISGASFCTDQSRFHAFQTLNYDSTKFINYNLDGDLLDSVDIPHTDVYPVNIRRRDTLPGTQSVVLEAGRLDTTWLSANGLWRYNLWMDGTLDSTQLVVDDGSPPDFDTAGIVRSVSTFPAGAVPFANSSGILTHDITGLAYDNTNLIVGHNNSGALSGIQINGTRAAIYADINGMLLQGGVSTTYDATKHFRFRNGSVSAPYLELYSVGTGPWVHYADFTVNIRSTLLASGVTPPTTSGTTKMVITDANGQLSFTDIPSGGGGGGGSDGIGLLHVVAGTKLSQVNDSTIKLADSVWSNIYARLSEKVKYTDTAAMLANIAAKLNLHTDSITSIHAQIVALASTLDDLLDTSGSIEADSLYYPLTGNPSNFLTQATTDALYSTLGHTHTFASLTSKPTTLAGYGITDAEPTLTAPNSIKRYLNGYKQFVSFSSDSVTEGSTNLYYTTARALLKVNVSDTSTAWSGYAAKINLHTDSIASIHSQIVGLASTSATHTTNIALKLNSADYIVRETPSGSVNGSNVTFTLANTPVVGKEMIFLNGVLQMAAGDEYSISGGTITFITAPETGDKIRVTYIK